MSEAIKSYITDWRMWLRGLIGAAIGGGATAVTNIIVAPETFHFNDAGGIKKVGEVVVISAIVSAALYLKQHPVPEETKTN